jgi:hypothetical protein
VAGAMSYYVRCLANVDSAERVAAEKAQRRAARQLITADHQEELRRVLGHVREGFARLDAGEIDEFRTRRADPSVREDVDQTLVGSQPRAFRRRSDTRVGRSDAARGQLTVRAEP